MARPETPGRRPRDNVVESFHWEATRDSRPRCATIHLNKMSGNPGCRSAASLASVRLPHPGWPSPRPHHRPLRKPQDTPAPRWNPPLLSAPPASGSAMCRWASTRRSRRRTLPTRRRCRSRRDRCRPTASRPRITIRVPTHRPGRRSRCSASPRRLIFALGSAVCAAEQCVSAPASAPPQPAARMPMTVRLRRNKAARATSTRAAPYPNKSQSHAGRSHRRTLAHQAAPPGAEAPPDGLGRCAGPVRNSGAGRFAARVG